MNENREIIATKEYQQEYLGTINFNERRGAARYTESMFYRGNEANPGTKLSGSRRDGLLSLFTASRFRPDLIDGWMARYSSSSLEKFETCNSWRGESVLAFFGSKERGFCTRIYI